MGCGLCRRTDHRGVLEFAATAPRGIRRIVAVFVNEHGEAIELTDVPAKASQCVLQDVSQTALQGRASHPGVYELRRLEVKDLLGVTHVNPPELSLEVQDTPEVADRRPA
jgi:hypothetical protein